MSKIAADNTVVCNVPDDQKIIDIKSLCQENTNQHMDQRYAKSTKNYTYALHQ